MLYDYDTFIAEDAALETEHFVDLMSASDLSDLSKTVYLTNEEIGDYHYGKVDHYRPIKLTASIQLSDDTVVYTKDGISTLISGSGIDATYVTMVSDMTTAPAEESIVVLPNGGSWFKFEKPFTLTSEDVENETTFQMKLAFNPEGVIKADSTIDTISVADLSGRWTSTCETSGSGSQKDIYDFDGGSLSKMSIFYTDDACSTEQEQLFQNFRMKLVGKATTSGGDKVKHINLIYDIYLVSGTDLYFGDSPASKAEDRPSSLGSAATANYTGNIP